MATTTTDTVVVLTQASGIALIPKPTALTRLNYFDGKFLRASDLTAEQEYHRRAQQLTAQAGGPGVVHGFELHTLAGDQVELAAGLAVDPEGRLLFMPQEAAVGIEDLIARSRSSTVLRAGSVAGRFVFTLCEAAAVTPTTPVVAGAALYVLGISHAEALCGQEDVYGKLCEESCVSGSERPQRLEGVVLRALPLQLASALPTSKAVALGNLHLRSRLASAYFADEAMQIESLISGSGLLSQLWCQGAAPSTGSFLPLAVLARAGGHTLFLDGWTARRERMDSTPRRYWQWRMAQRPWDVFLAQVLQFQCQLRDSWGTGDGGDDDPCAELKRNVSEVNTVLAQLDRQYRETSLRLLSGTPAAGPADAVPVSRTLLNNALLSAGKATNLQLAPRDRVLIRRGIVELPSAGYLPVAAGSAISVNDQVRRLLGEGVDLRFCVVRPDFVGHAMEEAQHMQRISLLRGLDNPKQLEEVDILVPDGEVLSAASSTGVAWEVRLAQASSTGLSTNAAAAATSLQRNVMTGAGRSEALPDGALNFFFAGLVETESRTAALTALKAWAGERDNGLEQTLWKSVELQQNTPATVVAAAAPGTPKGRGKAAAAAAATAPSPAEPTPQQLASRQAALREQAVAYRLKTLERVATTATTSGIRHFEGLADASGGKDSDHIALWLALRSASNPLDAADGSTVAMSMDLSLLSPKSSGTQFLDLNIVGAQFVVESRVVSGQRLAVQGTLRGAVIIAGLVGTLANSQRGLQFSVPALLTHEPTDEGAATRVEIDFSSMLFDNRGVVGIERIGVLVQTAQQNQLAAVRVGISAMGVQLNLQARLARNEQALALGHPLRAASEAAIDVIATRESAPNFATQARADLFGARKPQSDALVLRAKLDWVLFHRRRTKQCGSAPAAAVLEQRRYELHHLRVKTDAQLRSARAAVISANVAAIRKAGFAPFGAAAFEGGRSTLATATDALLQDWQAAQPGSAIRFGGIGSTGAAQAEGDALAQARIAALELALGEGALSPGVENQVLPVLPALNLAGFDGAVFLITQDTKTICHDVLRLNSAAEFKRFVELARRDGLASAMKAMQLKPFAHADFDATGQALTAASTAALQAAWGNTGAPQKQAAVFHASGTGATESAQTAAILTALGGSGEGVKPQASTELAQVTDCNALSVIVAPELQVVTTRVLVAYAPWDGRFIITANTPVLRQGFSNGQPDDAAGFSAAVGQMLNNRPFTLTGAVQAAAQLPDTDATIAAAKAVLEALQYTLIRTIDTAVLTADEIKALEGRGFKPDSYDQVLMFSTVRPAS
jgi:hypothetical protein